MTDLTPREIVSELDRFIIGQKDAKKSVALALRDRWRRKRLSDDLRAEVYPKNILMIGPTGVGKTEISRRLAKLANAPFLKVEATKFTEVGYVGRDVEQIIRDLVETAIHMIKTKKQEAVKDAAYAAAEERVLDAVCGAEARASTRDSFRKKLRDGELADKVIEIDVRDPVNPMTMFDMGNQTSGMMNIGELLGKAMGARSQKRKLTIKESYDVLMADEADKLIDQDALQQEALQSVQESGIVFLDEIDKLASRSESRGGEVSREGVQRDLLPLIEGTTVNTKYGSIQTDHILFIASGAFHVAKPSDLLPELQGRLPIRVELRALTKDDFVRILTETDYALTKQYSALLATENIEVEFKDDGIEAIAQLAADVNSNLENIGARRLYTILERVFEDISFNAPDQSGNRVVIDANLVRATTEGAAAASDVSRYML